MSSESDDDFSIVGKILLFVFVAGFLEPLGMLMYLSLLSPSSLDRLMQGGISLGELVSFLLASPDRLLVVAGIALLSLLFALKADPGGDTHHHNPGGGFN
jgi:hypothetical protein